MNENTDKPLIDIGKTRPVLENITNKWSILILTVLCTQPSRFNEIRRRLDGITHKALADALKRLERNGLVNRKVLPTAPISVEYSITPLAQTLQQPFMALASWAMEYGSEMEQAQAAYDLTKLEAKKLVEEV
ncbi:MULTISPECIES: winged helix-turn-helix transcriptional regulator [unclassified Pantoea]|uniref:winged helix-turn-helix transcriptional regulator n=1 Tax=unclassified Pantoea TaxID=2630326 RepID=UPI001CD638C5|nr:MULTISPECIES: helix-turn-helix domain-containing protein [unclassified Pantoea]MCA1177223.1 helix-turn-helix transcriptional regulator [Pantoea sp. alder69]MCA1254023.1 helix-turn-helix transcriptional regulator [Pantoea sp. alder70]MCA1265712.1 helix-turn-helix transcriptional regulator [Pantoea sp. alder81]